MTKQQLETCNAITRHFKVKRAALVESVRGYLEEHGGEESPVVEISLDDPHNISFRIGISKSELEVSQVLFFDKLVKTELYRDMRDLFSNEDVDFVVCESGKALIAIDRSNAYSGPGGLLVKNDKESYVMQPIKHYLEHHHPVYDLELL